MRNKFSSRNKLPCLKLLDKRAPDSISVFGTWGSVQKWSSNSILSTLYSMSFVSLPHLWAMPQKELSPSIIHLASHFLTSSFYPFSMIMYFSHNNFLTTLRCLATATFTQLPSLLLPSTSFSSRPLFQLYLWSYLSLLDFCNVNSKTPPQAYPTTILYVVNHTYKSDWL